MLIPVSELYEMIISSPGIEGVTYSGGEPFEQARGLYHLSKLLKEKSFSVMSYSGFTYGELKRKHDRYVSGLLSMLDIMIDGRFEIQNAAPLLWRGSYNQKVYFFTERYQDYEREVNKLGVNMEVAVTGEDISLTGNFTSDLLKKITEKLRTEYGIILK